MNKVLSILINKKNIVLILLLTQQFIQVRAQSSYTPINLNVFNREILGEVWSSEDTSLAKDYETLIFHIDQDSLSLLYLNWIEALSYNTCSYTKKIEKGLLHLNVQNCTNNSNTQTIYIAKKTEEMIMLSIITGNKSVSPEQIKPENWIAFTKVKE